MLCSTRQLFHKAINITRLAHIPCDRRAANVLTIIVEWETQNKEVSTGMSARRGVSNQTDVVHIQTIYNKADWCRIVAYQRISMSGDERLDIRMSVLWQHPMWKQTHFTSHFTLSFWWRFLFCHQVEPGNWLPVPKYRHVEWANFSDWVMFVDVIIFLY